MTGRRKHLLKLRLAVSIPKHQAAEIAAFVAFVSKDRPGDKKIPDWPENILRE
jgi:hypothetical protein